MFLLCTMLALSAVHAWPFACPTHGCFTPKGRRRTGRPVRRRRSPFRRLNPSSFLVEEVITAADSDLCLDVNGVFQTTLMGRYIRAMTSEDPVELEEPEELVHFGLDRSEAGEVHHTVASLANAIANDCHGKAEEARRRRVEIELPKTSDNTFRRAYFEAEQDAYMQHLHETFETHFPERRKSLYDRKSGKGSMVEMQELRDRVPEWTPRNLLPSFMYDQCVGYALATAVAAQQDDTMSGGLLFAATASSKNATEMSQGCASVVNSVNVGIEHNLIKGFTIGMEDRGTHTAEVVLVQDPALYTLLAPFLTTVTLTTGVVVQKLMDVCGSYRDMLEFVR